MSNASGTGLGWLGIARLGLVQSSLGAIVVLTTSTINRVMIVELSLLAVIPGLLVAWHYALQVLRPRWGTWLRYRWHAYAMDHRRHGNTGCGRLSRSSRGLAHGRELLGRHDARRNRLYAHRHRRRCGGNIASCPDGGNRGADPQARRRNHRLDHDDRGLHHHLGGGGKAARPVQPRPARLGGRDHHRNGICGEHARRPRHRAQACQGPHGQGIRHRFRGGHRQRLGRCRCAPLRHLHLHVHAGLQRTGPDP